MKKFWISCMLGLLTVSSAFAESLVALTGHVPRIIQSATKLEAAPADEIVQLSLVVRVDQTLLDQTLNGLYGPNAPARRNYLTSSEFAQQFGLAEKRQKLKDFAQANGLTVNSSEDRPESMVVKVSGRADAVEKTFSVHLNHYRGADGRVFRSLETDPMIPASLVPHLSAVLGLSNNTGVRHPHIRVGARSGARAPLAISGGTGPDGTLAPADIKTIYDLSGISFKGSGQKIALFELDGYIPSDLPAYESEFGLGSTPVTFEGVDSITQNICGLNQNETCDLATLEEEFIEDDNGMLEVALDLDMAAALAPGVSQILVYEGPNSGQGVIDTYDKIAADDAAQAVSTSWGAPELEVGADVTPESQAFQRMAAQGQTIYAAAGDNGADDNGTSLSVDDPASQPFVTGVGGTTLSGSVQAPVETVWNTLPSSGATGGGVSAVWPTPSYQIGVAGAVSQQFRNVPDVTLNADPQSGYTVIAGGIPWEVGGTSAAAPLWAAFTVLINEERAELGGTSLGFANTTFYQFGSSATYHSLFNDITSGNNGFYNAGPGYDDASGWGSFKGSAMLASATPSPGQLLVLNSLSNVYAFPNPWDTRRESKKRMTFANLPDGATVKLFTISGFLVKTLTASGGSAIWDLSNDSGQTVASGLYLFIANDTSTEVTGKVAIIK